VDARVLRACKFCSRRSVLFLSLSFLAVGRYREASRPAAEERGRVLFLTNERARRTQAGTRCCNIKRSGHTIASLGERKS